MVKIRSAVYVALIGFAVAQAQILRITAGEARSVALESAGARIVSVDRTRTEPYLRFPPLVGLDESGSAHIVVPPATPRGTYRLAIAGRTEEGRVVTSTLTLTVDAVTIPPTGKIPVILLNGWQIQCPTHPDSTVLGSVSTFGQLAALLQSDGVPVVFFNNCVYGQDVAIEILAQQVNAYIAGLTFADGSPLTQVDLVAHSMGGLIARAYLAGLQSDGSTVPPLVPKVRKLVELATPNFGSFKASLFSSTQTSEMIPGSLFLWNLATWNQRLDDMRGVDALALVGNGGPLVQANQSDGLVSLASGSIGFARPDQRTRIVPYCHVTPVPPINLFLICTGQGIADIDSPAHLSAKIVRSFLADTYDWQSIGTPPSQNQYLSRLGGMFFLTSLASGSNVTDLTQASFAGAALTNGGAAGTVFYDEFLSGSGNFQAVSTSLGTAGCGPFTEPVGFYSLFRCKSGPQITSVGPLTPGSAARVVPSGGPVTISGTGFGQSCGSCAVVFNPGSISLEISNWSDQTITAALPNFSGGAQITVRASGGSDTMAVVTSSATSAITIASITNAASSAPGAIAPGELLAIKGNGLGPAAGVSYSLNPATGMVEATLAGVRVFFGTLAAPILYASASQVNVVVPYEVAGQSKVALQVSYSSNLSAVTALAVAGASPAAFTFNSTGSGQAVATNQDYSSNGASNPAAKNSYVTIYFTGGGQTNPAGITGGVSGLTLQNVATTTATVGGVPATVAFSGAAPTLVDGVCQLNIQLSPNTPSGPAQPLMITIDGVSSPTTATIAVQ
jgi:uncharacterized protein (TIGR03437 family)